MLSEFFANYAHWEPYLARFQLILFMLGMGATLMVADFAQVFYRPRSLLVGGFVQMLILPFLAVMVNNMANLTEGIAAGLILVAAMPGGTLSKVFTYVGRGNVALSIALTVCTTLAALFTVPFWLEFLAHQHISMFYLPLDEILEELALYLLLPLAVGMLVARHSPSGRRAFSRWCIRIGFLGVVVMVVGSLGSGHIHPGTHGWRAPLAIIFFCVLAQQVSMLPFRAFPWPRGDRLAVGIEVTMRNMNLALLIKAILFPKGDTVGDGVLFVVLFYAGVALVAGLPLALNHRRMARKERPPSPSSDLHADALEAGTAKPFHT